MIKLKELWMKKFNNEITEGEYTYQTHILSFLFKLCFRCFLLYLS